VSTADGFHTDDTVSPTRGTRTRTDRFAAGAPEAVLVVAEDRGCEGGGGGEVIAA
jgi:hypothetical protein